MPEPELSNWEKAYEAAENNESPNAAEVIDTVPPLETSVAVVSPEVTDTPPLAAEPEIKERIVEKIVEKPLEFKDDTAKAFYEAFVDGTYEDKLLQYLTAKNKDYTTMSDQDVMREKFKKDHPDWSNQEVELELHDVFGDDLEKKNMDDYDESVDKKEYDDALAFNRNVDRNINKIARQARDARHELMNSRPTAIDLPLIKPNVVEMPAQPSAEEVAAQNKIWEQSVSSAIQNLPDVIMNIDGEEIVYKQDDDSKKEVGEYLKSFSLPFFAKDRGWLNEDGTSNILKLAEDVQALKNAEKIHKSIYTQAKTSAKKEFIKDIKNINSEKNPVVGNVAKSFNEAYEAVA